MAGLCDCFRTQAFLYQDSNGLCDDKYYIMKLHRIINAIDLLNNTYLKHY